MKVKSLVLLAFFNIFYICFSKDVKLLVYHGIIAMRAEIYFISQSEKRVFMRENCLEEPGKCLVKSHRAIDDVYSEIT